MRPEEVDELRRLIRVASGCVGPCGRARAVRTSDSPGARTIITSSAAAVLQSWPVARDHHVVRLVVDAAEAHLRRHSDCGWLFLNLCLRVALALLGLWKAGTCNDALLCTRTAALHGLALASTWLDEALLDDRCPCRYPLDWSHLPSVLSLLRSTLCKPTALADPGGARHVGVTVLEGFLGALPAFQAACNGLRYSWHCGLELSWCSVFRGLVLDTPVALAVVGSFPSRTGEDLRLALFDASLEQWLPGVGTGGIGVESLTVESDALTGGQAGETALRLWEISQFQHLADSLVEAGVAVLACQKLVDPWLVDCLRHRGVTVLSRLSLRHVEHMRRLSGAVPISSLAALPREWADVCGSVGPIESRTICERTYTLINAPTAGPRDSDRRTGSSPSGVERPCSSPCAAAVTTLLLSSPDEHGLAELRRCVPQAVNSLQEVARSGVVLEGAGLTEVYLGDMLTERARQTLLQSCGQERGPSLGTNAAACAVVFTVAECLLDVAACLHESSAAGAALIYRGDLLEGARLALRRPREQGSTDDGGIAERIALEAEGPKRYAILGALDLAGVLVRLGDTLDFANHRLG